MMNNIFSGKGGTIRIAIITIGIMALFEELVEKGYEFSAKTETGKQIHIKLAKEENKESDNIQPASSMMLEEGGEL